MDFSVASSNVLLPSALITPGVFSFYSVVSVRSTKKNVAGHKVGCYIFSEVLIQESPFPLVNLYAPTVCYLIFCGTPLTRLLELL